MCPQGKNGSAPRARARMTTRTRTSRWTAALAFATIVACSDPTSPEESSPVGTWNLVSIDDQDIPVLLDTRTDEECPVLVHFESWALDILADGTWDSMRIITLRCETTGKTATLRWPASGVWETFEGGIRLTQSSNGEWTSEATLPSRDVMEIDDSQHEDPYLRGVFRFQRAPEGNE